MITYVNHHDTRWAASYRKHISNRDNFNERYNDAGTLKHLVSLIRKNMPFIGKIYLIVSSESQVPSNVLGSVEVVLHKDIIPDKYLPTFNSCTIEMFLWKIAGLSEQFIYFNDDTFPVKPFREDEFFVDGKPVLFPELEKAKSTRNIKYLQNKKSSTMAANILGADTSNIVMQPLVMRPFLKSTCQLVSSKIEKQIAYSISKQSALMNMNAALFNNYDYFSKNYVKGGFTYDVISIDHTNVDSFLDTDVKALNIDKIDVQNKKTILEQFDILVDSALEDAEVIELEDGSTTIEKRQIDAPIKVALCCIAKNETLYIREWVEYYKNIGVDKIFIYDNNDVDGETFDQVLCDYIGDFIEIIDVRGKVINQSGFRSPDNLQGICYRECYYAHPEYDWMAFFDVDEFLDINKKHYAGIKEFLSDHKWDECDGLRIQWKMFGDNGHTHFDLGSVLGRFGTLGGKVDKHIKTILRRGLEGLGFCAHGPLDNKYRICNLAGKLAPQPYCDRPGAKKYPVYLNHFYSKSTEEYILRKWQQTSACHGKNKKRNYDLTCLMEQYFQYNKKTPEKVAMFESLKDKSFKISDTLDNAKKVRVALCAIAKNENLYIREWVEWYKNLGIAKIFLYDNNDIDGERFEDVIGDYMQIGYVEVINKRGVTINVSTDKDGTTLQGICYQDCFNKINRQYDWLCLFDIDEFLTIDDPLIELSEFLSNYDGYDGISVQWRMYGDNDEIYYRNESLHKRFKYESNMHYDAHAKTIVKLGSNNDYKFCAHGPLNMASFNFVNVSFDKSTNPYKSAKIYETLSVYLDHFYSKSTEEFFKRKYRRTSAVTGINANRNFSKKFLNTQYFEHNAVTLKKLDFIEKYENSFNDDDVSQTISQSESLNLVDVYCASLYRDGHILHMITSIINQPEVNSITVSCNGYSDEEYDIVNKYFNSSKLILKRTNNEKKSFEKLRFVNEGTSKYVAFCDDDLIFPNYYFKRMISECDRLDNPVSFHGARFTKSPIDNYYKDRNMSSFSMDVPAKTKVDVMGNGVSLMKRNWLTESEWESLYEDAPNVSMDDITISYILRQKGHDLYVVKHTRGEIVERIDNKQVNTVYNTYKNDCTVQTNFVNTYFTKL